MGRSKKPDFSDAANAVNVFNTIERATQDTPEPPMAHRTHSTQRVQKRIRLNWSIDNDVYVYLETMAGILGLSITEFANRAIREHKETHKDVFERVQAFRESIKNEQQ